MFRPLPPRSLLSKLLSGVAAAMCSLFVLLGIAGLVEHYGGQSPESVAPRATRDA